MADEGRKQMYDAATAEITRFIQAHTGYSLDAEQPETMTRQPA